MKFADFLLVGGGLASVTAAETLRAGDAAGSVAILSAEQMPPYHRPPLSKEFLLGHEDEARILIHPESFIGIMRLNLCWIPVLSPSIQPVKP